MPGCCQHRKLKLLKNTVYRNKQWYTEHLQRTKQRGLDTSITAEEFNKLMETTDCFYCGDVVSTIGLDRIDSSKDYHVKNVRLITDQLNRSTYNYSDKVIFKFAKLVINNFK